MKDIPVFTTEYGIASLILKEIPYREIAYIKIRTVAEGQLPQLVEECVGFCRAAGAERIFVSGDVDLEAYPYFNSILVMSGPGHFAPEASLWPVTEETVGQWRKIYNEKMAAVDNAGTLTAFEEKALAADSGTYFVHDNGQLLGIGWIKPGELVCVASTEAGMGARVVKTLLSAQEEERVQLEVASTNLRAISLYEKLGFVKIRERTRWYRVR